MHLDFPTPLFALAGFVAGLFGSLLGLGGGWLMVPTMTAVGLSAVSSVGSSLAAIVVTAVVSAAKYYKQGHLQLRLGLAFGIPSAFGVQLGKMSLHAMAGAGFADAFVSIFYVCLLLGLGASMLRGSPQRAVADATSKGSRLPAFGPKLVLSNGYEVYLYQAAIAGGTAGLLSGILGIGGGILLVPVMTSLFGLPVITAVATSLVSVLVSSSYGAIVYAAAGDWYPEVSLWLGLGALAGGYLGASLAPYAAERVLRRLFAALTLVTAGSIVAKILGATSLSVTMLFGGATALGALALALLVRSYRLTRKTEIV